MDAWFESASGDLSSRHITKLTQYGIVIDDSAGDETSVILIPWNRVYYVTSDVEGEL